MIAAILLTAGASQRMGEFGPKALLRIGGTTLFERVAETAKQAGVVALVAVIAPPHGPRIAPAMSHLPLRWAHNPQPERGMLSSVQAGISQVPDSALGALVWPIDIAFVSVASVRALLAGDLSQPAVLTCEGRGGHPLWLPRRLFDAALSLSPEVGLRALRQDHPPLRIETHDPEILRDLDTPGDLAAARARFEG